MSKESDSVILEPRKSKKKTIRIVSGAVGLVLVGFAILLATRKPTSLQTVTSPLLNKSAPSISGTSLTGTNVSLSSYRGNFVLINFFASWCIPCHQEEKSLVGFANEGGRVKVLGVAFDDRNSSASAFLKSYGATYQALGDTQGQIALSYGVGSIPKSYLIAPNGTVLTEIVGPLNLPELNKLISVAKSEGY